jgi:hypothetical protein
MNPMRKNENQVEENAIKADLPLLEMESKCTYVRHSGQSEDF